LPALKSAQPLENLRVKQGGFIVGESTTYDILIKSAYPIYSGDLLTLEVPAQAA